MWLVLGGIAIIATFFNLYLYIKNRKYSLAMAIGLSFTTLTLVAQYNMVSDWAKAEDWSAIGDVTPTMGPVLWILAILSILLNLSPLFLYQMKGKN